MGFKSKLGAFTWRLTAHFQFNYTGYFILESVSRGSVK